MMNPRGAALPVVLGVALIIAFSQLGHGAPQPEGKVYHVAQNHPKADDANPGGRDLPWRTLQRAASSASAGDTVLVHEGVYREQVSLDSSGRPGRPITFRAEKGKVVIAGSDLITDWTQLAGSVYHATVDWWAPEGWMKCRGKAGNWDGEGGRDTDEVFVDGEPLRETSDIPTKPGRFHYDHDRKTLSVWLTDSQDPRTKTIEAIRRGNGLVIRGSHVHVEGFVIRNVALQLVYIRRGDHNVILNNVLRYSAGNDGIHLTRGADHNLVKNNSISHVGYTGVEISRNSNYNTIQGNEISHCCSEGIIIQNGDSGGVGHKFIGNTIHHVFNEDGIDLKCGRDLLVRGNTIYKCSNLGIQIFNHHGSPDVKFKYDRHNKALIENNVVFDNGGGGIYVFEGEYEIRNNVIYGNGHEEPYGDSWGGEVHRKPGGYAIEIGPCFEIEGRPLKQRIYNNTCYRNARGEIWIGGPWEAAALHCAVKNNILVGGPDGILLKVNRIGAEHLDADHNALWIGQGGFFAEWKSVKDKSLGDSSRSHVGTRYGTFSQYRAGTGMGKHSLHTRPGFVNAEKHAFTLATDSPCLAAGAVVGLPFQGKAPNIGATLTDRARETTDGGDLPRH